MSCSRIVANSISVSSVVQLASLEDFLFFKSNSVITRPLRHCWSCVAAAPGPFYSSTCKGQSSGMRILG